MTITFLDPAELPVVEHYRQVSISRGTSLITIAGQVSWDADGNTVGKGDLAAQVERCYLNVGSALREAGASFDNVVKLTAYVPNWTPDKMQQFGEGVARAAAVLGIVPQAPASLIGVAALDIPEHLVEIEAMAVLG